MARITIADIYARRARAGPLRAPTASYSDSDMFKTRTPEAAAGLPRARRWDGLLSAESAARGGCVLKQAARHLARPGMLSLGGGLPCPEYFPFERIGLTVPSSTTSTAASGEGREPEPATEEIGIGKHDVARGVAEYDLAIGLNYGQASGAAQMLRWVTEHTELVAAPPYADWRCALTVGSTGALEQALRMLCDGPGRGDALLTEEHSFSTAVETAMPLGIRVVGVRADGQGLVPESMDDVLRRWDERARGARRPRVLYTVPSGQNPTGATQGPARRRDLYDVCRLHDVYILEDEPYYFLQMPPYVGRDGGGGGGGGGGRGGVGTGPAKEEQTLEEFLDG